MCHACSQRTAVTACNCQDRFPVTIPAVTIPTDNIPAFTAPAVTVPAVTVPAVTVHAVTVHAVTVPAVGHCKGGPASERLQPLTVQTETLQSLGPATLPASQQLPVVAGPASQRLPAGTAEEQLTPRWTWQRQKKGCTGFSQPARVIACATSSKRVQSPHVY